MPFERQKIKRHQIPIFTLLVFFWISLGSLACRAVTDLPSRLLLEPTMPVTELPAASSSSTPEPLPTATLPPLPSQTSTQAPGNALLPDLEEVDTSAFQVRFHPDDALVVGDHVSMEVIAPPGLDLAEVSLRAELSPDFPLGEATFERFGIAGRRQATLYWAWNTQGFDPGEYQVHFSLQPGGPTWTESIELLPADSLSAPYAHSTWAQARSECCVVHYMTGTAAERDLEYILEEIDRQAQDVAERFGAAFEEPVTLTLLARLLGHGGFAGGEIQVSYLDRNYAAGAWEMVVHHEMVHILDSRTDSDSKPSLLVEGLAVYLTGGHFKPEPLMPRAAALLDFWGSPAQRGLGWYVPLEELANHFYTEQHEIGYLQAAALVEYMIDTYGWQAFLDFYRGIPADSESQALAIDTGLREHFDLSLSDLERDFISAMSQYPADPVLADDVRLSVQFYDMVRRYQQLLDPSAYFLTAWLVDTAQMRQAGIVADYLRHPEGVDNLALETMLAAAGGYISQRQFEDAEAYLAALEAVMDAIAAGVSDPFTTSSIAADYYAIVRLVEGNPGWVGAEPGSRVIPQRISLDGLEARVWLTAGTAQVLEAHLERGPHGAWQFLKFGAQSTSLDPQQAKDPNVCDWGLPARNLLVPVYGAQ